MEEQPAEALFACTKCHSRHVFEDLSHDEMLCKSCQESVVTVMCNYCREEFHLPSGKASGSAICKKCQNNVKLYGKPSACEYCNINAAFIGSRCQRCTNSERRWGAPVACDECRLRCAFRRPDDSHRKVDGRTLCWRCTLSYKRVKARARKRTHQAAGVSGGAEGEDRRGRSGEGNELAATAAAAQAHSRRRSHGGADGGGEREHVSGKHASTARQPENSSSSHKHRRTDDHSSATAAAAAAHPPASAARHSVAGSASTAAAATSSNKSPARSPEKKTKIERSTSNPTSAAAASSMSSASKGSNSASNLGGDATLSENMITITRLHEEVEALKKQLLQKEQHVLERDRKLTEVKARHYEIETELRNKISSLQKSHSETISNLQAKNKELMKQVATLSKSVKKTPGLAAAASATSSPAR